MDPCPTLSEHHRENLLPSNNADRLRVNNKTIGKHTESANLLQVAILNVT